MLGLVSYSKKKKGPAKKKSGDVVKKPETVSFGSNAPDAEVIDDESPYADVDYDAVLPPKGKAPSSDIVVCFWMFVGSVAFMLLY